MDEHEVRRPAQSRLSRQRSDYNVIIERHERAVEAGASFYIDPETGFNVLTVTALLERGSCCSNGCRHCPYVAD